MMGSGRAQEEMDAIRRRFTYERCADCGAPNPPPLYSRCYECNLKPFLKRKGQRRDEG